MSIGRSGRSGSCIGNCDFEQARSRGGFPWGVKKISYGRNERERATPRGVVRREGKGALQTGRNNVAEVDIRCIGQTSGGEIQ